MHITSPYFAPSIRSLTTLRSRTPSVRAARHPRLPIKPSPSPPLVGVQSTPKTVTSFDSSCFLPSVLSSGPHGVLTQTDPAASLLKGSQLAIVRKMEMLNVLMGYDQANQYSILNELAQPVGYIVEHDTFGRSILRNFLHTHRPMHATILDTQGVPILKIHRPFNWINSTITISRADSDKEIGIVEQEWHLWRRRYNLFNSQGQFARIDAPILSWAFTLTDENINPLGVIDRNFTGFGRELFTDTGHYAIHFTSPLRHVDSTILKLDERAVTLAAAVTIDFDYFSRERGGIMPMGIWIPGVWGGGSSSEE